MKHSAHRRALADHVVLEADLRLQPAVLAFHQFQATGVCQRRTGNRPERSDQLEVAIVEPPRPALRLEHDHAGHFFEGEKRRPDERRAALLRTLAQ